MGNLVVWACQVTEGLEPSTWPGWWRKPTCTTHLPVPMQDRFDTVPSGWCCMLLPLMHGTRTGLDVAPPCRPLTFASGCCTHHAHTAHIFTIFFGNIANAFHVCRVLSIPLPALAYGAPAREWHKQRACHAWLRLPLPPGSFIQHLFTYRLHILVPSLLLFLLAHSCWSGGIDTFGFILALCQFWSVELLPLTCPFLI